MWLNKDRANHLFGKIFFIKSLKVKCADIMFNISEMYYLNNSDSSFPTLSLKSPMTCEVRCSWLLSDVSRLIGLQNSYHKHYYGGVTYE